MLSVYNSYQVVNLAYHTAEGRTVLTFYNLRNLVQTEQLESTLLVYRSTNLTFNLLDFYCCHFLVSYPLNTFSMLMPRVFAIV